MRLGWILLGMAMNRVKNKKKWTAPIKGGLDSDFFTQWICGFGWAKHLVILWMAYSSHKVVAVKYFTQARDFSDLSLSLSHSIFLHGPYKGWGASWVMPVAVAGEWLKTLLIRCRNFNHVYIWTFWGPFDKTLRKGHILYKAIVRRNVQGVWNFLFWRIALSISKEGWEIDSALGTFV